MSYNIRIYLDVSSLCRFILFCRVHSQWIRLFLLKCHSYVRVCCRSFGHAWLLQTGGSMTSLSSSSDLLQWCWRFNFYFNSCVRSNSACLSGIANLTFGIFFMVALKVRSGSTVSHVDHGSMTLSQVKRSHLGRRQLEWGVVFLSQQSTYNVIYIYMCIIDLFQHSKWINYPMQMTHSHKSKKWCNTVYTYICNHIYMCR